MEQLDLQTDSANPSEDKFAEKDAKAKLVLEVSFKSCPLLSIRYFSFFPVQYCLFTLAPSFKFYLPLLF